MAMTLETLFAIAGTLGWILYFALGLKASSLQLASDNSKGINTFLYAAMPWSLDWKVLKPEGKKLCFIGNIVMVVYTLFGVAWAMVKYAF